MITKRNMNGAVFAKSIWKTRSIWKTGEKILARQSVMRRLSLSFFMALVASLSSCQFGMKTVYNNLDTIGMYQLDVYFDLTSKQEEYLEIEVDKLLVFHRSEELPRYRSILERGRVMLDAPRIQKSDLEWLYDQVTQARERVMLQGLPAASTFLSTLSDAQWQHMKAEIEETAREEYEDDEELSEEEFRQQQEKEFIDGVEDVIGDFAPEQIAIVKNYPFQTLAQRKTRLEANRRSRDMFFELFASNTKREELSEQMRLWIEDPSLMRDEGRNAQWKKRLDLIITLWLDLLNAMTAEQRENLRDEIDYYDAILADLIA